MYLFIHELPGPVRLIPSAQSSGLRMWSRSMSGCSQVARTGTSRWVLLLRTWMRIPRFDPFRYRFGLVDRGGTGRFLFGVRFYDPGQGVWVQQDSLDAPLDPVNGNRYGYAGSDPVNNFDPTGRLNVLQQAAVVGVGAVVGGAVLAIPGAGTAISGAAAGCAGGALSAVFEGEDLEGAVEKCLVGAVLGALGGQLKDHVKNTMIAVIGKEAG